MFTCVKILIRNMSTRPVGRGGGEVGLCRGQSIDVIRNFFRPAVRINNSIVYTIGVSVIPSAFNV